MILKSKVNNNSIYLPQKVVKKLNLHHGDNVLILCTNNGMQIVKDTMLNQLDLAFEVLGHDLEALFLPEKVKNQDSDKNK
mgnify:CR=1 FL=1